MKKFFAVLALTLMTVVMAFAVAGCGTDTAAIDELNDKIDELTESINDLKKKNENLQNQINWFNRNYNVFWTDKKEYSATETMTVYYGQTAVFKIRLGDDASWSSTSGTYINFRFYLTSLCADILEDTVATATYFSWDNGTYNPSWTIDDSIAKKDVEKRVGGSYKGDGTAYNSATSFDFVVGVPGTSFELARFKNVKVSK